MNDPARDAYRKTCEVAARRKPPERVTLPGWVEPFHGGLRTVTGQERAYREVMGREPPAPHPSGQFAWRPRGRESTPERADQVISVLSQELARASYS